MRSFGFVGWLRVRPGASESRQEFAHYNSVEMEHMPGLGGETFQTVGYRFQLFLPQARSSIGPHRTG
jgi:hypothetical protein